MGKTLTDTQSDETIRIPLKRIDALFEAFGEQVVHMLALEHYKDDLIRYRDELVQTIYSLKKITYDLQQSTLSLRMVPLRELFEAIEISLQTSAQAKGKSIGIHLSGHDQEIEKSIADQIAKPLVQLATECLLLDQTEPASKLSFRGMRDAGSFVLELGVAHKNVESQQTLLQLPGMKDLKEALVSLKGSIEAIPLSESVVKYTMRLPLSLSLFNGLCFINHGYRYIVPSSQVIEIVNSSDARFRSVNNDVTLAQIRDEVMTVIDLRSVLIRKTSGPAPINATKTRDMLLVTKFGRKKAAFRIEQIAGIIRVVQKPLTSEMSDCPGSVGVSILGDGMPAIIVNLKTLAQTVLLKNRDAA
jgi:two-component system chemotaxis sensor kinase CheA